MFNLFDVFQTIIIILFMFYFYYQLDQKIEKQNKNIIMDNKSTKQKLTGLTQLLTSYLK